MEEEYRLESYVNCTLCPRQCSRDRSQGLLGICGTDSQIRIARAALHYWEEPCISGKDGSGAVFFAGCPLHCVYCQNEAISHGRGDRVLSIEELAELFLSLQAEGANNINLVTPTHYRPHIIEAVIRARAQGLHIPIVYNTSGYETEDSIKALEGIVDIYLTDFKYMSSELAGKYSHADDYPEVAMRALAQMLSQQSECHFNADGMLEKGVIVRQLLLPGHVKDFKAVTDYLYNSYGDRIYISMMSQFTPMPGLDKYPELNRRVTRREYDRAVGHALDIGVTNAFIQEMGVAKESFIPQFNGEGDKPSIG